MAEQRAMSDETRGLIRAAISDAELRALAEASTPGPWATPGPDDEYLGPGDVVDGGEPGYRYIICEHAGQDAHYIAAASPDRILALLDERDALLARAVQAEEKVARVEALLPGHPSEVVSKYAIRAALREEPTTEEVDHE